MELKLTYQHMPALKEIGNSVPRASLHQNHVLIKLTVTIKKESGQDFDVRESRLRKNDLGHIAGKQRNSMLIRFPSPETLLMPNKLNATMD
jgi:hypothetical protein